MVCSLGTSVFSCWSLFIEFLIRTFYMSFTIFWCSSIPVTVRWAVLTRLESHPLPAWPWLSWDMVLLEPFSQPPFCSSVLPCFPVSCWFVPFSWSLVLGCFYIHFLVETIYISWLYYHLYWRPKFVSPTEDPNLYLQLTSPELRILRLLIWCFALTSDKHLHPN